MSSLSSTLTAALKKRYATDNQAKTVAETVSELRLDCTYACYYNLLPNETASHLKRRESDLSKATRKAKHKARKLSKNCSIIETHNSSHGLGYGTMRHPWRSKMHLDSFLTLPNYDSLNMSIFAVFDGHGTHGSKAVAYLKKHLPTLLSSSNLVESVSRALAQCDSELRQSSNDFLLSGCSVTLVIIQENRLYCANIGKSRAVLAKEVSYNSSSHKRSWVGVELSREHSLTDKDERDRIEKCGGVVVGDTDENMQPIGVARVCLPRQQIPGLPQSRSIGDSLAKTIGVTSEADFSLTEIGPEDKFLILGSAFLFTAITPEECIKTAAAHRSRPQKAAEAIVRLAHRRECEASVLVVRLKT